MWSWVGMRLGLGAGGLGCGGVMPWVVVIVVMQLPFFRGVGDGMLVVIGSGGMFGIERSNWSVGVCVLWVGFIGGSSVMWCCHILGCGWNCHLWLWCTIGES